MTPWVTGDLDADFLAAIQRQAAQEGRECVVGGLVANRAGQIFVQKRSAQRRLFPGCWDIVGGHVEPGEMLRDALAREILEETGWRLADLVTSVARIDWTTEQAGLIVRKREFDFVVTVNGDLEQPQLERDKVTEYRWIGAPDVDLLSENRQPSDSVIADLVRMALTLTSPH